MPDLEVVARNYIRKLDIGDDKANQFFLEETYLGKKKRGRDARAVLYSFFQTSSHSWMWDSPSRHRALKLHGFLQVRQCSFGDSEDPMFRLVEDARRFEGAIGMEGRV